MPAPRKCSICRQWFRPGSPSARKNTFARSWKRIAKRRERWNFRRPDRAPAAQLHQFGLSVNVIENAFVLAAPRRLMRPADAPQLDTIRSLGYFLPVIEEVLGMGVSSEYFQHVRRKLERIANNR